MPGSLEHIRHLWEGASEEEREKFLFDAMTILQRTLCEKMDSLHGELKQMKTECACRVDKCEKEFVTKKQAKIFGFFLFIFAIGIALGAGYLTWKELLVKSIPSI